MILKVLLVAILVVSLVGAFLVIPVVQKLTVNSPIEQKTLAQWTVMVYCDADNNLETMNACHC